MASFIFHVPSAQIVVLYINVLVHGTTYLYILKNGKRGRKKKVKIRTEKRVVQMTH